MLKKLLVCAAVLFPSLAHAQQLFPERPLDCVIRPSDMIELSSYEEGVLTEVSVKRGDQVEEGQIIARLESQLQDSAVGLARLRAENTAAIKAARARIEFRMSEVERLRELFDRSVTSKANLEKAEVELQLARMENESALTELLLAKATLADAELRLSRREIRAAASGLVVKVSGSPGEYVDEQTEVLTIAKLDPLYVEAFIPIKLFPKLHLGQAAFVDIGTPIDETRKGSVSAIDRVFDAASGTLGVRLDLPNPDGSLPSGLRCGLRFVSSKIALSSD